ncbi:MAG TPA: glycosyltransferase family 39 protein [Bryobacteraceae bacterium]|nr:glycosyltransferase family 39 protein [Bryobacteraceae bacterium]
MAASADTIREMRANARQAKSALTKLAPYLLGLYFALWSLWGAGRTGIVDTDAARHAMNGAFIYDLFRSGHLSHPVEYAEQYYGHLPALSMPYHPPLFPALEALFFALFGVKLFTARLAVAAAVGASAALLYRLTEAMLENRILAACVTATVLSLESSQLVAQDVMLEFPSMAFLLAALCCLTDVAGRKGISGKSAVWFAIFAAAAFWSKQHAVLLGGVAVLTPLLSGRGSMLFRKQLIASVALFGASVFAYIFLSSRFHNVGIHDAASSAADLGWIARATIPAYFEWAKADLAGLPAAFAVCAIAASLLAWRRQGVRFRLGLYWAWIVSTALVLADLGDTNNRYLFFLFPATVTLGYAWLYGGCARLWGHRAAAIAASGFALAWVAAGWRHHREFLRGPAEAADMISRSGPARALYAGEADGQFIFAVRAADPKLEMTVISGGKLPREAFQPSQLEEFCARYGIDWLIVEDAPSLHPWNAIAESQPGFLRLERSIPLESTRARWRSGFLNVYRVLRGKTAPGGVLEVPVPRLGGSIPVKL